MLRRDWALLKGHAPGGYRQALLAAKSPIRAQVAEHRQLAARVKLTDLTPCVGVVWFPLVAPRGSVAAGCLARIEAHDRGRPLCERTVVRVRRSVLELAGLPSAPVLDTVPLSIVGVPSAWTVSGRSLELAAVVALVSVLIKTPVDAPLVVSGRAGLQHTAEVVGHRTEKARICRLEAPDATHLICDTPFDLRPWLDRRFPTGWRHRLFAALQASPERQAREAWLAYTARDTDRAERLAASVRSCTTGYARGLAHWVEGACRMHRGDPTAIDLLMVAVAWFRENRGERRYEAEELSAFAGVALLANGRAAEAVATLQERVVALERVPLPDRFVDWARAMVKVAGTLRRALVAAGRLEDAVQIQRDHALPACGLAREERARCLLDLGATLAQASRMVEARRVLAEARDALPDASDHFRASTQRYLELQEVRAGIRPAGWSVAPFDWRDHPQPLEALEQLLTEGPGPLEAYMQGQLAALSKPSYPQLLAILRVGADATRRWGSRPWVVALAERALDVRPHQDATMRAAISALCAGDGAPFLRVAPY